MKGCEHVTDCNKAREMISDYIDGILNEEDSTSFEEHISCCEKCHEEYDMIKAVSSELAESTAKLPDGFSRRMHTALVNAQFEASGDKPAKKVFTANFRYARFATVAAAVMVFAVVGKYGVYDVYKNVVNETNNITGEYNEHSETDAAPEIISPEAVPETASVEPKKEINTPDISKKTTAVKKDVPVKAQAQTKELTPENTNEQQNTVYTPVQAETGPQTASTGADDVTSSQDKVFTKSRIADSQQTDTDGMAAEKLSQDSTGELQENSLDDADAQITSSGSGGAAVASAEPEEEAYEEILTDADKTAETTQTTQTAVSKDEELSSSPTVVEINKSGDGSMLVFKKYLYTFLDSSEISENGDVITVTVSADEFTRVIEKISANEYVKSMTMGTNVNGEAVITIK